MNKVILIGRLTRDPELRYTPSGAATCNITVAIDRMPDANGQRNTDFIPIVVWSKQAENVCKYLAKGRLVAVEGRVQTRNYDDKDGKRVYVTEVVASNVQFLESKNGTTSNNTSSMNNNGYQNNSFPQQTVDNSYNVPPIMESVDLDNDPFASFGDTVAVSDNDLPF